MKFETITDQYYGNHTKAINAMCTNSTNYDLASTKVWYRSDEDTRYDVTVFGLVVTENVLLDKYLPFLKKNMVKKTISPGQLKRIEHRPEIVSVDEYQTPELWYLILALNDMTCPEEFEKIDFYYTVDIEYVLQCLEMEETFYKKVPIKLKK